MRDLSSGTTLRRGSHQKVMARHQSPSFLVGWVLLSSLILMMLPSVEARNLFGGRLAAAAIFGKNSPEEENIASADMHKPTLPTKPPPPPPPMTAKLATMATATPMKTGIPPPPPPKSESSTQKMEETSTDSSQSNPQDPNNNDNNNIDDDGLVEEWPVSDPYQQQQEYASWQAYEQHQQQQQQQQAYYSGYNEWPALTLEEQLQDSRAREEDLLAQIHNLTQSHQYVQQQDHIHSRQMDVLTERIMEAEAQIAHEQNQSLEYQANCTELGRQIAVLHQELSDWQSRCAGFADQQATSDAKIKELKQNLDEARAEAENLAISIENARIRDQMDVSGLSRKKKRSKSLLGWLFSFIWSEPELDDTEYQTPQDLAKSTLLRALQIERNNIDELEGAMATLQRNNSAIAEMVKSRDLIIDELNDRVAVFEEDKVVLKAALKQLQKEMKEEAPRTEKLISELGSARQENTRLATEVESLVEMHQGEISSLQRSIAEAQNAANASESNLTAIGQYVDTLEQRLASFAIIRRDVELREQKCKEVEEHAVQLEQERDNLRTKIEEFEVEQSDLKALFEELVQEQTSLRDEKAELIKERDSLLQGAQRSREALASLEVNMKKRDKDIEEWRTKALGLEKQLNETKGDSAEVQKEKQAAQAEKEDLQQQVTTIKSFQDELEEKLTAKTREIEAMKEELEAKAAKLKENDEILASRADELKDIYAKLDQREEALKKQKDEISKLELSLTKQKPEQSTEIRQPPADTKVSKMEGVGSVLYGNNITGTNAKLDQNKTMAPDPGRNGRPPAQATKPDEPQSKKRQVPLRKVRKFFSKTTGVHGAFSPPSTKATLQDGPSQGHVQSQLNPDQGPPPSKGAERGRQPPLKPGSPPPLPPAKMPPQDQRRTFGNSKR